MSDDDAYDYGDPKRSDYNGPRVCALCHRFDGHYTNCPDGGS